MSRNGDRSISTNKNQLRHPPKVDNCLPLLLQASHNSHNIVVDKADVTDKNRFEVTDTPSKQQNRAKSGPLRELVSKTKRHLSPSPLFGVDVSISIPLAGDSFDTSSVPHLEEEDADSPYRFSRKAPADVRTPKGANYGTVAFDPTFIQQLSDSVSSIVFHV